MTFVDGRSPPLGHIRLFREEILESGLITMKFVDRECVFLDATFVEKLRELFKEDPGCAVKHLFHKIAQCYPEETRVSSG
ncbi:hypothetical protein QR680_006038 [Steinernema hermaphroditum]|uniref:Uncharacterized protein n=1 Tax=Steinernema hermaphroditum TaxID=289476 RepID=A0AA39HWG9_9BILA|nr:hypothetical protein QR680_006038 [Steinernema hermaphroditum]